MSSLKNIMIRECLLDELPLIQKIEQDVYNTCTNKELFSLLTDSEFYLRIKPPNFILGCFENQHLIGYIIYKVPDEEELIEFDIISCGHSQNDTVILDGLAVLPLFRGKGLQRKMMEYFEAKVKENGRSHIVATVHPENSFCLNNFIDAGYLIFNEKNMPYGYRYLVSKEI